jgi:hypothetical protein
MRGKPFVFIFILCVAALGLGWFIYSRWSAGPAADRDSTTSSKSTSSRRPIDDPNRIKSGPNYKPIEPILGAESAKEKQGETPAAQKPPPEMDYGMTQPVRGDLNPQTKSIVEAVQTKSHPERLSPLIPPKPFDPVAYKQNPKIYLDVVEPGRVFQTANPGKEVPSIVATSPLYQEVVQGKSVKLRVKAVPRMPCSFTSFDLGHFQNQLTGVTVEANDQGIAEADFFGAPGTINEVKILASSPVSSGQVRFIVFVKKS